MVYYTYDNAMRVTQQANMLTDGTIIAQLDYTYDVVGNQLQKKETTNGIEKITNYTYDIIYRLSCEQTHDGTETTYTHDMWNNISAKTITSPVLDETDDLNDSPANRTLYYNYNGLNQLTSIEEYETDGVDVFGGTLNKTTEFTYDANGNMLSKTIDGQDDENVVEYGYTYNPLNQLTEFEDAEGNVTTYAYDGTGMRVSKTQGENVQRFYWDRGYIVNESTNGTFTASNSIGTQGIFARTTGSGENTQTDFLFKNAHGDVTDVVSNDEVTNEYDYDAYGNQKNTSANDSNPFRYCGEYYDEESGLIYLRNRYYDPEIGRFITEDPIQDGMNWYAYCGNNPVMFVDPWGLTMRFYDDKQAQLAVEAMNQMGGYSTDNGYYVGLTYDSDGNYSSYYIGDASGNYSGGSETARALFSKAISDSNVISYGISNDASAGRMGVAYFYCNGEEVNPNSYSKTETVNGIRSSLINLFISPNSSIETIGLILAHETAHGVAWNLALDQNIHYRSNVGKPEQAIIHNYWQEAVAINVQYHIANELNANYQNNVANKYYIKDNKYYHSDGHYLYGASPIVYSAYIDPITQVPTAKAWYRGMPLTAAILN